LPPPWFDHDAHAIAGRRAPLICWRLIELLWLRRDRMVMRESIMTLLYGEASDPPGEHNLNVYICHLRRMLAPPPFAIETERKRGYRLIGGRTAVITQVYPMPTPEPQIGTAASCPIRLQLGRVRYPDAEGIVIVPSAAVAECCVADLPGNSRPLQPEPGTIRS
jgi:hypothetical protein